MKPPKVFGGFFVLITNGIEAKFIVDRLHDVIIAFFAKIYILRTWLVD